MQLDLLNPTLDFANGIEVLTNGGLVARAERPLKPAHREKVKAMSLLGAGSREPHPLRSPFPGVASRSGEIALAKRLVCFEVQQTRL